MKKLLPAKSMIIPMLLVVGLGLFIYNKVPKVAQILGNPNKA